MKSISPTNLSSSAAPVCGVVVTIFGLLMTGCVASGSATAFKQAPVIVSFTTSHQTITKGSSTVLSWTVNGATSISIDSTGGPVTGANSNPVGGSAVSVSPMVTTTYTLTATNPAGMNTATVTVNVTDQLKINSFTANPALIAESQSSTLSWDVTGAVDISIDSGIGDVTGSTSVVVNPTVTTEYGLTAIDGTGTRFFAHATVTVVSPPTIASFTATPSKISTGQSSTLAWNVVGTTTSLAIDQGVGDVTGKTSLSVSPTATTTYTLTATNTQGSLSASSTKQVTVSFSSSFVPTVSSFTASAASVASGHGVTLTAVFNAGPGGTATIDNGVGTVSSGVPVSTASLTSSVTFTLTVANGSNSVTAPERIVVGNISDFAGTGVAGSMDGPGATATFDTPLGLAVDSAGNVYVGEGSTNGGPSNDTIRKITPAGDVSTLAGTAGQAGSSDGVGAAAQFNSPQGVAVDATGNIYVADSGNSTIRKITPAGEVSTFAGTAGQTGSADGTGAAARFNGATGVAVGPSGNIYVADTANHTVRVITPAGVVTTLAGSPSQPGCADGMGAAAKFNVPNGIAVDTDGNLYVADLLNCGIRVVTPAGTVTTLVSGPSFRSLTSVTVAQDPSSGQKYVYVTDPSTAEVRRITPAGVVETIVGGAVGSNSDPAGPLPGTIPTSHAVTLDPSRSRLYISLENERIVFTPF